jgi:hypothetical protein
MIRLPVSICLLLAMLPACKEDPSMKQIEAIVQEIKEKYAPDKRVALLNYTTCLSEKKVLVKGETNLPDAKAELFEKLNSSGFSILDSLTVLPSSTLAGKHFGVVNVSVCNIRSEPKHSAELATQALLGTPLRVWKEENGFYLVQTPDGYLGWLDDGGFALMDSTAWQSWLKSERIVCLEDYAFVYETPAYNSAKVSDLMAGNILQMIENQGIFTRVRFPDGRTGFVQSARLMPFRQWLLSRQADTSHVFAAAFELMGRPYLWGGTSGKGMDCSGFTKTVFYLNGILLPRDASQQVHVGKEIETDTTLRNAQPGDLLFFGRKATAEQKEKIWHVGIYLGDGQMIHASDKVELASLRRGDPNFKEERLTTLVRCKRILGSGGANGVVPLNASPFYQWQ